MQRMIILFLCSASAVLSATPDAAGHWEGKLQMPGREFGLIVDLSRNPKGVWIGSMSLVGSSASDVPLEKLTVHDSDVMFAAYLPDYASFEGNLSDDLGALTGTASNASGGVPFQLLRKGNASVKVPPPNSPLSNDFAGTWEGIAREGEKSLRVRLKLFQGDEGLAAAALTSVDQGNQEIPVTTVTIEGKQLRVEARAVSGTYRGTLGDNGEISGEWVQGPAQLPLVFKRAARPNSAP